MARICHSREQHVNLPHRENALQAAAYDVLDGESLSFVDLKNLASMSRAWGVIHALVIATHSNHARPSGRRTGPVAIGPALVAPGTRSKSPASPSRQRGRDLEAVFFVMSMRTSELGAKNAEYNTILEASRACAKQNPSRT